MSLTASGSMFFQGKDDKKPISKRIVKDSDCVYSTESFSRLERIAIFLSYKEAPEDHIGSISIEQYEKLSDKDLFSLCDKMADKFYGGGE